MPSCSIPRATASPRQGRFSAGALHRATATRLQDGRVLIVGFAPLVIVSPGDYPMQMYHPQAGLFTQTAGAPSVQRIDPATIALLDGRVLVSGGQDLATVHGSVELFDPQSETFSAAPSLSQPRHGRIGQSARRWDRGHRRRLRRSTPATDGGRAVRAGRRRSGGADVERRRPAAVARRPATPPRCCRRASCSSAAWPASCSDSPAARWWRTPLRSSRACPQRRRGCATAGCCWPAV